MFSNYMSLADDINLIKCPRSWYLVAQLNTWLFVMILFQHSENREIYIIVMCYSPGTVTTILIWKMLLMSLLTQAFFADWGTFFNPCNKKLDILFYEAGKLVSLEERTRSSKDESS